MSKVNARKQARYSQQLDEAGATTDEDIARQIAEDPDTAPELTDEWFDRAEIRDGDKLIRPGRPPLDARKKLVSLRLDQESSTNFALTGRAGSRA